MEIANAFLGRAEQPTSKETAAILGSSAEAWKQLIYWLAHEQGVTIQEWNSSSPKLGWSLRLKLKKRTIIYLSPCNGCFRAALVLGDRAVEAARQSKLPQSVVKAIADAPHYAEGTGVRLLVKSAKELVAIRKLVEIKLAN